jgi:hypothetical protein
MVVANVGEPGIQGVVVSDHPNGIILTTWTEPSGEYVFNNLPAELTKFPVVI